MTEKQIYLNWAWEICEWTPQRTFSQKLWWTMLDIWNKLEEILNKLFDKITENKR